MGENTKEKEAIPAANNKPPPALLNAVCVLGEATKKRLSHVDHIKETQTMLSEVRQEHGGGGGHLKHVDPISKQDLLQAVRTQGGDAKKHLGHVEHPKSVQELLSEVRHYNVEHHDKQ